MDKTMNLHYIFTIKRIGINLLLLSIIITSISCSNDDESHKLSLFLVPNANTVQFSLPSFFTDENSPFLNPENAQYDSFKPFLDLNNQLKNEYIKTLEFLSNSIDKRPKILPSYNKKDTLWYWNYKITFNEKSRDLLLELKQQTVNSWKLKIKDTEKGEYQIVMEGTSKNDNLSGTWSCSTSTLLGTKTNILFLKIDWETDVFGIFKKQVYTVTDTDSTLSGNVYTLTTTSLGSYSKRINLEKTDRDTNAKTSIDLLYHDQTLEGHIQKVVGSETTKYCWDKNYEKKDCVVESLTVSKETSDTSL